MNPRVLAVIPLAAIATSIVAASLSTAASRPFPAGDPVQQRTCATRVPTVDETNAVQSALTAYLKTHPIESLATGGTIKVAFHVIYSGSEGNIPQSQIDAQIAELNKAYAGQHGGVNTGYKFTLASVSRTNNSRWFKMGPGSGAEKQAKAALATDVTHRLNVYTCKPGQNLLGWSYFPTDAPEGNTIHGVVIHYGSVPGGYLAPYNLGGTLDHEVGHYLGLYHTFQGGCTAPGDQVSDTPDEATATSGCPNNKDTCPTAGADPVHNYMDYSDDACYTQFTAGQDARMDAIVPAYRPSLLNAALAFAGAGEPAAQARPADSGSGELSFRGAFPNPFSKETTLHFALAKESVVSLRLYNVAGQLVATLFDGRMGAGEQTVSLRAAALPPGMYFAALSHDGRTQSRSIVLLP